MKLFIYDHCPFCTRARMIFPITNQGIQTVILPNDEQETIKMIGKKMTPVLQKKDGTFMCESLDIVRYINEANGAPLKALENEKIARWADDALTYLKMLAFPRVIKLGLEEFKSESAIEFFRKAKEKMLGMTFEEALQKTNELATKCTEHLKELSPMIKKQPTIQNKDFSEDDILLFPILRLIGCVKGVKWEKNVKEYMVGVATTLRIPLYRAI